MENELLHTSSSSSSPGLPNKSNVLCCLVSVFEFLSTALVHCLLLGGRRQAPRSNVAAVDLWSDECRMQSNTLLFVLQQLAAQLITRQVIGNFNEAVWPFLKESYRIATRKMQHKTADTKRAKATDDEEVKSVNSDLSKSELESCMYTYESTFDDYLELVVQFGYVMLFAPVFPLAALCAFLNNLIEIRSDAFKLCYVYQRPFGTEPLRVVDEWTRVLSYLSVAAIATNCGLMALVTGHISRVFALHSSTHVILTGVAIEVGSERIV